MATTIETKLDINNSSSLKELKSVEHSNRDIFSIDTLDELEILHNTVVKNRKTLIENKDKLFKLILYLFEQDHAIKAAKLHAYMFQQSQLFLTELNKTQSNIENKVNTDPNINENANVNLIAELNSIINELNNRKYKYIAQVNSELESLLTNVHELESLEHANAGLSKSEQQRNINSPNNHSGWKLVGDTEGIKSYYRKEDSTPTHSFMVKGQVNSNIFNIVSLIYEIDLYKNWFPMIKESKIVHHMNNSRFRMLLQMQIGAIWPISDRETSIYAYGDCVGDSVAIYTRSVKEHVTDNDSDNNTNNTLSNDAKQQMSNEIAQKYLSDNPDAVKNRQRNYEQFDDNSQYLIPEPLPGQVRADMLLGAFFLTPISSSTTDVIAVFNIDPKLSMVPYSALNWFTNKICYMLIKMIREQCEKYFGEKYNKNKGKGNTNTINIYQQRIANNRRVYGEIERRIKLEMKREIHW